MSVELITRGRGRFWRVQSVDERVDGASAVGSADADDGLTSPGFRRGAGPRPPSGDRCAEASHSNIFADHPEPGDCPGAVAPQVHAAGRCLRLRAKAL